MTKKSSDYKEKFRPQYHFSPEWHWMNDPNGMVFYEGEYHLFYQHNPISTSKGPMHWGHAVSEDLVHWEHLPVALEPDEYGVIYSGSAVVDRQDTSGFFDGGSGLVAIFTHHDQNPEGIRRERQSLAYSIDKGRTWTKYEGNPVIVDESIVDFRDPKVFWHSQSNQWVMVIAAGDRVRIYTSFELKTWVFASEFGMDDGSHSGVWECPDLFELPVDGDKSNGRYVLIVSIGGSEDSPEGSRTQYFIGSFDGTHFVNENPRETVLWLDYGRDNYAGVTWSNVSEENGRTIYLGWMSNWKYARVTPTVHWKGAMTLPRTLTLRQNFEGIRMYQSPVAELQKLRRSESRFVDISIPSDGINPLDGHGDSFEIVAEFELDTAQRFGFKVRKSETEETVIGYDSENRNLFVDRTNSGISDFFEFFAGTHAGPMKVLHNKVKLHIYVDRSSIEVFGNEGEIAITEQIFPELSSGGLELFAENGQVKLTSLEIYLLKSVW